ncbi:DUF1702 family protein [Streptomyces griseocarneus]|uniref:DUF1702 family protein n=1 Tax=Streptomyces griseocarneus TaxID=51201 RepID=UPI00167CC87A|nr:DUF1702 family protein [Streptomyces griseocarneus]MBZ6477631.1 DUF1702 family protein [Streptomyces griseocarneus]GHG82222.1 enediyne biosynthesis protein [Streptomyces griseocarneus]
MSTLLRALRRKILTPGVSATNLDRRGFHKKNSAARDLLEMIGRTFLEGYGHAVGERSIAEAEARLEAVPRQFRGFAYEGAAMGATVLDALPGSGGRRLPALLSGRGRDHEYMAYVGVGWAMARLPRFRWPDATRTDPLLRWLVLDGYGFHQAYFHTERYVRGQFQDPGLAWGAEPASYHRNAIDQGIGRALWFVAGTDPERAADLIDAYPAHRRPDLYSGTGLAATYAGGADEAELRYLAERSGAYRPQLLQGAAFAAEARERAGLTVDHTRLATRTLCDMDPAQAAKLCSGTRPDVSSGGDVPAYEIWRRRIAEEVVSRGRG